MSFVLKITSLLEKNVKSHLPIFPFKMVTGNPYMSMALESIYALLPCGVMQSWDELKNDSVNLGEDASRCIPLVARGLHSSAKICPSEVSMKSKAIWPVN